MLLLFADDTIVLLLSAGHSLLHISWLMVVLSRVFVHHEAKTIVRWGVQETLNMNLEGSPLLQEEHWKVCFVQTYWVGHHSFIDGVQCYLAEVGG